MWTKHKTKLFNKHQLLKPDLKRRHLVQAHSAMRLLQNCMGIWQFLATPIQQIIPKPWLFHNKRNPTFSTTLWSICFEWVFSCGSLTKTILATCLEHCHRASETTPGSCSCDPSKLHLQTISKHFQKRVWCWTQTSTDAQVQHCPSARIARVARIGHVFSSLSSDESTMKCTNRGDETASVTEVVSVICQWQVEQWHSWHSLSHCFML